MATFMTEVCTYTCIEPELQPVTDENLAGSSANCRDGVRLDITANGGSFERNVDVRVVNPHVPSNRSIQLPACYRKMSTLKIRAYKLRVQVIEHASLTPIVI